MIEQHNTRTCGNCGEPVAADDTVCGHCDALLAAYEAPPGATAGSSAAIDPIDMAPDPSPLQLETSFPPPPAVEQKREYESPTAQSLDALDAQKPQAATISTTFDLPQTSPVAEALRQTRIAADLDAQGERSAETEAGHPPKEAPKTEEPRQLFGMSVKPATTPARAQEPTTLQEVIEPDSPGSEQPQQSARERLDAIREARRHAQGIAEETTIARPVRPASEDRVRNSSSPLRPSTAEPFRKSRHMPGIPTLLITFAIIVAVIHIIVSSPAGAAIMLPIVIGGLIWFLTRVARNSGRKTTSMPRDRDFRK